MISRYLYKNKKSWRITLQPTQYQDQNEPQAPFDTNILIRHLLPVESVSLFQLLIQHEPHEQGHQTVFLEWLVDTHSENLKTKSNVRYDHERSIGDLTI